MQTTQQASDADRKRWARLDHLLLGRTLHVEGLSPLHVPAAARHDVDADDDDDDDEPDDGQAGMMQSDLDSMAEHMFRFLTLRVSSAVLDVSAVGEQDRSALARQRAAQRLGHGYIRRVQASFIDDLSADGDDYDASAPKPFAIQVEVQPPTVGSSNPYAIPQATTRKSRRPAPQSAHLLFVSSSKRATPTHYPLMLWKAPPPRAFAPPATEEQDPQLPIDNDKPAGQSDAQPTLTARILIAHTLDFLARYFDCRFSQQAPLSSVRAAHMEQLAEAIMQHHRKATQSDSAEVEHVAVEVGYALPTQVENGIGGGGKPNPGPAPHLNLISMTVPVEVVRALLQGVQQDAPFLPALQHYLASNTSLQLSRLTLVRVGIADVYIGVPTDTTVLASMSGKASGEIRMKINALDRRRKGRDKADTSSTLHLDMQRINLLLRRLVAMTEEDDW